MARLGPPHWRSWPSAAALTDPAWGGDRVVALRTAERVKCNYEALGLELAAAGVTVTCAPVLDLPQPDAHDVIGDRAFGSAVESVVALGRACLEGLQLAGIAGVIKHIPGHGRARATPRVCPASTQRPAHWRSTARLSRPCQTRPWR
ncbi:MAG: hypothetical protein CM15mP89_3680 [Gammaproteobacteria bacterium]|nr:MAG: hypothetical protein CM15mP89_3680 [Gammaproteobacteria bacterium]